MEGRNRLSRSWGGGFGNAKTPFDRRVAGIKGVGDPAFGKPRFTQIRDFICPFPPRRRRLWRRKSRRPIAAARPITEHTPMAILALDDTWSPGAVGITVGDPVAPGTPGSVIDSVVGERLPPVSDADVA